MPAFEGSVAADDGFDRPFVRPATSSDLTVKHFLQRVGRAVGFERPDFHFAEALTAELRLAAERLLRDERVGTNPARMDLVVDEVMQLQHVDVSRR